MVIGNNFAPVGNEKQFAGTRTDYIVIAGVVFKERKACVNGRILRDNLIEIELVVFAGRSVPVNEFVTAVFFGNELVRLFAVLYLFGL